MPHVYQFTPQFQLSTGPVRAGAIRTLTLSLPGPGKLTLSVDQAGSDNFGDHSIWIDPQVIHADRRVTPLTSSNAIRAEVAWPDDGRNSHTVGGKNVSRFLWAHARSEHVFTINDKGLSEFRTSVAIADGGDGSVNFRVTFEPDHPVTPLSVACTPPALVNTEKGVTYYVDPTSGNDAADGRSASSAFRSLARLSQLRLAPGCHVLLRSGATYPTRLSLHGAGTADQPITIATFGNDGPAILAPSPEIDEAIMLNGARYVAVRGIAIAPRDWAGSRSVARVRLTDPSAFESVDLSGIDVRRRNGDEACNLLALEPTTTRWDLSHHAEVDLRLKRSGTSPATVEYRLESAGAGAVRNCVSDIADLTTADSTTLRLPIVVRPRDPGDLYFCPYFMYVRSMDVRDGTVDPTDIRRIQLRIDQGNATLERVALGGQGCTLPKPFFPFIDAFGQYIHGHWHGKVYSDQDLHQARADEAKDLAEHPGPTGWDEYGGDAASPVLKATGHFRTEKVGNKWWLVDPAGHLFFSYGPTGVGFGGDVTPVSEREFWFAALPPKTGDTGRFWHQDNGARYMYYTNKPWTGVDLVDYTLTRKYGDHYDSTIVHLANDRLRSWGFNTIGNWSDSRVYLAHRTPYTVAIHAHSLNFGHHHDVFDPAFRAQLRARLHEERGITSDDPWNIGYFVDNELQWGSARDGLELAQRAITSSPDQWAKREFCRDLQAKYGIDMDALNKAWHATYASWDDWLKRTDPPDVHVPAVNDDMTAFAKKFAKTYFTICRDEVKRVAPNTLYLGCRFHGHIDGGLMKIAADYCDVISYNIYDATPTGRLNQYVGIVDKPFMVGEWGFGSDYRQTPFGRTADAWDPDEHAMWLQTYMTAALRHPLLVGAHFFQYRDQPISGRPDGEAVLRGFINATDTPHDELIRANRNLADRLYSLRKQR
ncbi:MAG: hypothetical protein ACTHLZ_02190 [Tepidisphaeraceae bacterium]